MTFTINNESMGHAHGPVPVPVAGQNQQTAAGTLSVLFYRCQVAIIVHMLPEQLSHCLNNYWRSLFHHKSSRNKERYFMLGQRSGQAFTVAPSRVNHVHLSNFRKKNASNMTSMLGSIVEDNREQEKPIDREKVCTRDVLISRIRYLTCFMFFYYIN